MAVGREEEKDSDAHSVASKVKGLVTLSWYYCSLFQRVYITDTVVVTIVGAAADQGALRLDAELQTNITHAISLFQKIISQLRRPSWVCLFEK